MSDQKSVKKRTSYVVSDEIQAFKQERDRAIAAARDVAKKVSRAAELVACGEVNKIKRDYTDPAMAEEKLKRDKSRDKAKQIHDAAVAVAHGEFNKSLREIDANFEKARASINETEKAQIHPHDAARAAAEGVANQVCDEAVRTAQGAYDAAAKPLEKEFQALKAEEMKTAVTSEMSLTPPAEKKSKKHPKAEAGGAA